MRGFLHIVNNLLSKITKSQLNRERFFLIFIITILVVVWFKKGLILGSGESGLPFYNTSRLLELLKSNWTDVPTGSGGSIGFPSYPLYATITFFQQLNVPSFILQATMFWFIFVIGVLSVHKIASLIEGNFPLSRFSSALFYIFNPIVHIAVLHRFQYHMIFFYSFLPLAFLIYIKGLKSKNFIYLMILSLVSLIFSFSFVGPAFLELLFGVLALFTILYFLSTFRQNNFFPLLYFLGFVVIFTLVNAWWLTPLLASVFVDLGSIGSVKYFNPSDNVGSFKAISEQIESVLSVFRLFKPNAFPKDEASWHWIYGIAPFIFLSFFSAVAFIVGLFKKEKQLIYKFLILVALLTMLWMKGTLAPFGGVTLYIFESLTFLHVFRNPFEKIGMLLPFAMAIPVGFGTVMIINVLASKLKLPKKIVTFLILTLVFPVYMFPIVTGLAFTGGPPPANNIDIGQYVKVPDYYREAREWLDQQDGLFRVLVLPIDGEGMTYKWEYGFSGVELSNNLFNHSMISLNTSQGDLPQIVGSIKETMLDYPEKLWTLAQLLNVRYIMVRDDIDYLARATEDPASQLSLINGYLSNHFLPAADFSKLKFFEINPVEFYPRIFASTAPIYLSDPLKNSLDLIPLSNPKENNIFITSTKSETDDAYIQLSKKIVINGVRVEDLKANTKDPVENLPFVSFYRDTPFYALIRLKEELESQTQTEDTQLGFRVNLLGKRVAEINHSPQDVSAVEDYLQLFQVTSQELQELAESNSVDREITERLINQRQALEEIKRKTLNKDKIDWIISDLDRLLISIRAKSIYPTEKSVIYRFSIPRDSKYEILVAQENWNQYFKDSGVLELDLDGKIIKLSPSQQISDKDTFSLGTYMLNQGIHEVSVTQPKTINLIAEKLPEEFVISSQDKQPITKAIPIADLDNGYTYQFSFEYLEEKGNIPVVALHSDVDFVDKSGKRIPSLGIALTRSNYDFGWKKYTGQFTPAPASHKYNILFKIIPFGDCKAIVQRPYRRYCQDAGFKQKFLLDSTTKFRNLKIEKVFSNPIILKEVEMSYTQGISPAIEFEQISPARYKVKVANVQNPFFLVLSTAFDPRWNAYFTTSKAKNIIESLSESTSGDPVSSESHLVVNGYANAWYIDKLGNYEMFLEYSPERVFIIGQKFSFIVIIIMVLIVLGNQIYVRCSNR